VEIDAKIEINERPADDVIRERLQRLMPTIIAVSEGHENFAEEIIEDEPAAITASPNGEAVEVGE
jgi:hypothetical protein